MIEVKNITKKYGSFTAVDNISFKIEEGEIIGLLGPNGAGKSTTMNMITGYIEPTEGEIVINGYDISKKPRKAKSQIGYMPEGVPLYSDLTVKEFVKYEDNSLILRRELEYGVETVKVTLPALICVMQDTFEPTRPLINGIKFANRKQIKICSMTDIGLVPEKTGIKRFLRDVPGEI